MLEALGQLQGRWQPDFVNRVIIIFLETAMALSADLEKGSAAGHDATLHQASHALKGCSATVGATSLSALCGELESMARAGAVPDAVARVDAIIEEYRRVEAVLIGRLAKQALQDQQDPARHPIQQS